MSDQENQQDPAVPGDVQTDGPTPIPEAVAEPAAVAAPTAEQTRDIFVEPPKGFNANVPALELANETYNETAEKLNNMPNVDYAKSQSGREFLNSFRTSMFTIPYDSWYAGTTYRPGSFWMQDIPSEGGKLHATTRRWNSGDGAKLTGEAAMMRVRQALGQGTTFTIPLWHTGIWVTLKAPSEDELVELDRRLAEEKTNLGRQTHGMIFGNNSAIFAGVLADFAIEHIYDSNLIENERSYHQIISCLDLPLLIWGLAYTIWPQGYQYTRVKLNPEDGSYLREEGLLKLGALQITDNLALTDRQRAHMSKQRGQKVNLETIRIYQEQFLRGQPRKVEVNEHLAFTMGVPTIAEYLESGANWVHTIIAMVDKALGAITDFKKREDYITRLSKATNVRQFSHWVRSIEVDGAVIDGREDIENSLDVYSASDEENEKFFDAIQAYVEDSTISVVAVTRGDYEEASTQMKQFPNYLVLDTMSTFFILLFQKMAKLAQRA